MLTLTDAALTELKKYFESNELQPVRVFLAQGGCSGPQLALGLDEKRDGDEAYDFDGGISLVMDGELMAEAKPVTIDMGPMGFTIGSSLPVNTGGCCGSSAGGCGSGCGTGGGGGCC
ncbi:MAG: IscA/HesB family protein [Desulfovibrionaceae bacterium]